VTNRPELLALLDKRVDKLTDLHRGHWSTVKVFGRYDKILGVMVVTLSIVVGTTLFVNLQKTDSRGWQIAAGVVAMVAAVLAGLQTFLNYSERRESHQEAGVRFGDLKRWAELLRADPPPQDDEFRDKLVVLQEALTKAEEASPPVPTSLFRRAEKKRKKRQRADRRGSGLVDGGSPDA
jgi:hypothetical protein